MNTTGSTRIVHYFHIVSKHFNKILMSTIITGIKIYHMHINLDHFIRKAVRNYMMYSPRLRFR